MIDFLKDACTLTGALVWIAFFVILIAYSTGIVDLRLEKAEDDADKAP